MSLLSLSDLDVRFDTPRGVVQAVRGVDLSVEPGETVGLIGESGCGKSTLAKAVMRLTQANAGRIELDGTDITHLPSSEMKPHRAKVQMVFQDTTGSLNPRRAIGDSIGQPLVLAGWRRAQVRDRVAELLEQVGLSPEAAGRFPNEFSGGQRQRIGIARALSTGPKLVICDEPVSALDVSVRAQVLNLMTDLQARLGVSYLFVSHDLSVVEHIADRIVVMYLGRIVEEGHRSTFWARPLHPYTRSLLDAVPVADPRVVRERRRALLEGELPSSIDPPNGCAFHTRCRLAVDRCRVEQPLLVPTGSGNRVACHLVPAIDPGDGI